MNLSVPGYLNLYWEKGEDGCIWGTIIHEDHHIVVCGDSWKEMKGEANEVLFDLFGMKNPKYQIIPIRLLKS
jgi:hypothetical protein